MVFQSQTISGRSCTSSHQRAIAATRLCPKRWPRPAACGARLLQVPIYISGKTDFEAHPVYQTAWLKFGSTALGIDDDWGLPAISDGYKDIFWMPLSNQPEKPTSKQSANTTSHCSHTQWHAAYPYLTWACDHTQRTKHGPISDQDWPLTFEAFGSRANHANVGRRVDQRYASSKIVAPHSWHAAEVFLYLHALR